MRRDQNARCAEAALQCVMLPESLRRAGQALPAATRQTFDCSDLRAIGLRGQHQTGADRRAIDNDSARPAYTVLTADVCPGELKIATERIGQAGARFDVDLDLLAVDSETSGPGRH